MDVTTLAVLSMFGAIAAGGLVGALVGWMTRFEVGLGAGLLVPGVVCLWFALQCLNEYQTFLHAGPNGAWGEVIAIEERAVNAAGDIVQPVPVIRFTAPDQSVHTLRGPGSSSMKIGEAVNVIYDPVDPVRSRVGQLSELRGGAIGMMLFGTFPLTLGLWFLYAYARKAHPPAPRAGSRSSREKSKAGPVQPGRAYGARHARANKRALALLFLALVAAMLWIGVGSGDLGPRFAEGFGAIAIVFFAYAVWGVASRSADSVWAAGMITLGVNFGVWAYALHLIFE